jgi:hypothetical protein
MGRIAFAIEMSGFLNDLKKFLAFPYLDYSFAMAKA